MNYITLKKLKKQKKINNLELGEEIDAQGNYMSSIILHTFI